MSEPAEDGSFPMVNIEDVPHVDKLYDLVGIVEDLKFAAECFDRLGALLDQPDDGQALWVERQALFSAAAVAYSRCFGTGVRGKLETAALDRIPQAAPGEARKIHKFICDMRDKHIAHSVSPFEAVMICGAVQPQDGQEEPLIGVGILTMQGLPVGTEAAIVCRDLARNLVNDLHAEIEGVTSKVRESLKREDPETFARRPTMNYVVPGLDQAGIPRRFGRGIAP
ncbi:hypothetical protein [Nocardia sp. NPDC059691]|uniref:hypothetical protein n=1 Tax=Nocardia sp. NPDC059691 TaxID=3346908 RepID=UPI0036B853DC